MPYMLALGDDSGTLPPAIAQWQREVRARGNVPTRMPKGPNVGKLAERYVDAQGAYRYALASAPALAADGRGAAVLAADIAAGKRVEAVESAIKTTVSTIANAPRELGAAVLGIPPWAVTGLALGAGALVLKTVLGSIAPRRAS